MLSKACYCLVVSCFVRQADGGTWFTDNGRSAELIKWKHAAA